jgi:hypothetical protein
MKKGLFHRAEDHSRLEAYLFRQGICCGGNLFLPWRKNFNHLLPHFYNAF